MNETVGVQMMKARNHRVSNEQQFFWSHFPSLAGIKRPIEQRENQDNSTWTSRLQIH